MTSDQSGDWRSLAERATKETDPNKMLAIITELNRLLEYQQTVHQATAARASGQRLNFPAFHNSGSFKRALQTPP